MHLAALAQPEDAPARPPALQDNAEAEIPAPPRPGPPRPEAAGPATSFARARGFAANTHRGLLEASMSSVQEVIIASRALTRSCMMLPTTRTCLLDQPLAYPDITHELH